MESMELEIKNLQKHMGGLVKTILDLKIRLESLERKMMRMEKMILKVSLRDTKRMQKQLQKTRRQF